MTHSSRLGSPGGSAAEKHHQSLPELLFQRRVRTGCCRGVWQLNERPTHTAETSSLRSLRAHYGISLGRDELHNSLSQSKIDFKSVRDPWGMPYHAEFSVDKQNDKLTLSSSGADKRYDTG